LRCACAVDGRLLSFRCGLGDWTRPNGEARRGGGDGRSWMRFLLVQRTGFRTWLWASTVSWTEWIRREDIRAWGCFSSRWVWPGSDRIVAKAYGKLVRAFLKKKLER
jgi:hypothetical protein